MYLVSQDKKNLIKFERVELSSIIAALENGQTIYEVR